MDAVKLGYWDQVLVGNSTGAMISALEHAENGTVLLLAEGTCLYGEMNETGDYRLPREIDGKWKQILFPDALLEQEGRYHPDQLKKHGEAVLREHGISLLYAAEVIGQKDGAVLFAHKSGLYAVSCREAWDLRGTNTLKEPIFLLHSMKGGEHCVTPVPVQHTGRDARETFSRFEEALKGLPEGHTPARCGTAASEREGLTLSGGSERPLAPYPEGTGEILFENPLFTKKEHLSLPVPAAEEDAWDIIVVGGGTAGASTAIFAARQGYRTLLLEMNRQLGGTATAGGVSAYWFGIREGATRIIDDKVQKYYSRLGVSREMYVWSEEDTFLPDLKAQALLSLSLEAGVEIRFSAVTCGVLKNGRRVEGVYWAQDGALHLSRAKMVLDTTGDGDVCVFAGAAHWYGNEQDGMTYWGSLAQYTKPDDYTNNFSAMVHVGDPVDYTRFIQEARKLGGDLYDHGQYVAVRESRHIRGMETVTLEDILSMRRWEKPLYTCFSNYDPKGRLTSELVYLGLLPPNQRIDIPRGAVIPVDREGLPLEGILVGGKAISCTHDAFPGVRMQPDLQRQGLALAVLAGAALRQNVFAGDADGVEETITALGGDLLRAEKPEERTLAEAIRALREDEPWEWLDAPVEIWERTPSPVTQILTAKREDALPLLRKAWEETDSAALRLTLGRLLLWHGDETGTVRIIEEIDAMLSREALPKRKGSIRFAELLPDHGLMPETVYLLNTLANVKKTSVVPVFTRVLVNLEKADRDWEDVRQGIYCYCESFALAARKTGDKAFIPLLHRILLLPELTRGTSDPLLEERFCMLRLTLYDALRILGDPAGTKGLMAFVGDERRPLALAAEMLLKKGI